MKKQQLRQLTDPNSERTLTRIAELERLGFKKEFYNAWSKNTAFGKRILYERYVVSLEDNAYEILLSGLKYDFPTYTEELERMYLPISLKVTDDLKLEPIPNNPHDYNKALGYVIPEPTEFSIGKRVYGIDPANPERIFGATIDKNRAIQSITEWVEGQPKPDIPFPKLLEELLKYYEPRPKLTWEDIKKDFYTNTPNEEYFMYDEVFTYISSHYPCPQHKIKS